MHTTYIYTYTPNCQRITRVEHLHVSSFFMHDSRFTLLNTSPHISALDFTVRRENPISPFEE